MGLGELEMNIFAGEAITITGPAHVNVQGGLSASVMQQGTVAFASGKTAMVTASGTKSAALVGGGKVSAVKVSSVASGGFFKTAALTTTLSTMAPTLITVAALTAGGYLLYRLNNKVLSQLDASYAN